jgi:hypothetical protein
MGAIRRRLTYSNVVATICLFLLLGGGAWAAATSFAPAIHACYSKRTGALRVASRCRRSERALSWNRVGPRGLTGRNGANGANGRNGANGATGATGGAGATGPTGPSDVYADGTAFGPLTATFTSFGQIVVPPGSYLLQGKATFFASAASSAMDCNLAPDVTAKNSWDGGFVSVEKANFANVSSLSAVATFTTPQTVNIICRIEAGTGTIDDARVIATKTASVHGSTPVD